MSSSRIVCRPSRSPRRRAGGGSALAVCLRQGADRHLAAALQRAQRLRSARTARALAACASGATSCATRASPARASMASAPWPTAGSMSSKAKAKAASSVGPGARGRPPPARCRPWPAPRTLRRRVCTLPRMSTSSRSGRRRRSCERRRRLELPTRAPGGELRRAARRGALRARHEHVAHVLALGERHQRQAVRHVGRHVLGRVHGQVGAAVQHGRLQLLGEQALVADLGQGRVQQAVALGVDDLDLHVRAPGVAPAGGRAPTRSG